MTIPATVGALHVRVRDGLDLGGNDLTLNQSGVFNVDFDNDAGAHAPADALRLRRLVGEPT